MLGDFFQSGGGILGRTEPQLIGSQYVGPAIGWTRTGPPSLGYWHAGDILISENVLEAGKIYLCTADGAPGTWCEITTTLSATEPPWSGSNLAHVFSFVGSPTRIENSSLSYESSPRLGWTNLRPDAGYWKVGDILISTNVSYPVIYICVAEGTPGTWYKFNVKTPQDIRFAYDFVNTGWNQTADSNLGALGSPTNVTASNGSLVVSTAAHVVAAPGTDQDELFIDADVPFLADNSGILARLTASRAIMFSPSGTVGAAQLRFYENTAGGGAWSVVKTGPTFVVTGGVYNLKAYLKGTMVRAWVDGYFMGEIATAVTQAGRVGFRGVTPNVALINRLAYWY